MVHVSYLEVLARLLLATALGGAIGLERELSAQPAGFRTHVLVSVGAALFTVVGAQALRSDPTRVAAQVVSGIGFLGAGAILREGASIKGLTTAATLWLSAAVGLSVGLGAYLAGVSAVLVALLALVPLKYVEDELFPRRRGQRICLDVDASLALTDAVAQVRAAIGPVRVREVNTAVPGSQRLVLGARLAVRSDIAGVAERLRRIDGVVGVDVQR